MTGQPWSVPRSATDSLSDERGQAEVDLVRRAQAGDRAAFGALFDRHAPRAYALACGLSGDQVEAEDLVQAAFLQALGALSGLRNAAAFGPWLSRIVVNLARDTGRRRARLPQAELSDVVAETYPDVGRWGSPEAMALAAEEQYAVQVALSRLAPSQRAALAMREIGGLSSAEIAGALGARATRVDALLFRARARFRAEYDKALGASPSQTAGCRQARGMLAALAAGQIGAEERARALAHVDGCGVCAAAIEVQREARRLAACIPFVLPVGLREVVLRAAARLHNPGAPGVPGGSWPASASSHGPPLPGAPGGMFPATPGSSTIGGAIAGAGGAGVAASGSVPALSASSALVAKVAVFAVAGLALGGIGTGPPGPASRVGPLQRGAAGDANRQQTARPSLAQVLADVTVSPVLLHSTGTPLLVGIHPDVTLLGLANAPAPLAPDHYRPKTVGSGAGESVALFAALPPQNLAPPGAAGHIPPSAISPPLDIQPEALSPLPAHSPASTTGVATTTPSIAAATPIVPTAPVPTAPLATPRSPVPATATLSPAAISSPTVIVLPSLVATSDPTPGSQPTPVPTATSFIRPIAPATPRNHAAPPPRPTIPATATATAMASAAATVLPAPSAIRSTVPSATPILPRSGTGSPTRTATGTAPPVPSSSPTGTPSATLPPWPTPTPSATPAHAAAVTAGRAAGAGGTATPRPSSPKPASGVALPTRMPSSTRTPAVAVHSATATPLPPPSATRSPAPTPRSATSTPSATRTPTPSPTVPPSATETPAAYATVLPIATATEVPSSTPTPTVTATLTVTPVPWTPAPTDIPTATPTFSAIQMGPVTAPVGTGTPGQPPATVNQAPSPTPTDTPSPTPTTVTPVP